MIAAERSNVVSSFTIIKGAMIPETYEVLARWDPELTKKANLDKLRDENYIGAQSVNWLRDVAKVLNRRLDPDGRDQALVTLAKGGFPIEEWKPILLWHTTRDEFLFRDFLVNWLFAAHQEGVYRVRPEDLYEYLQTLTSRGGETEHEWSPSTLGRVATGLLKMAADFGLLTGGSIKEFSYCHVPERSVGYLLRAILEFEDGSARRMLESDEWHMYLMGESEVRNELLRLHQFREVQFESAGSVVELSMNESSSTKFAQELVA